MAKPKKRTKTSVLVTAGKDGMKGSREDIKTEVPEPEAEPTPEVALPPERIHTVRGTVVGGTRQMTDSQLNRFNKGRK